MRSPFEIMALDYDEVADGNGREGLAVTGIEVFQDVLDLEPGDRWERELYRNIDECDLFLLFWSTEV